MQNFGNPQHGICELLAPRWATPSNISVAGFVRIRSFARRTRSLTISATCHAQRIAASQTNNGGARLGEGLRSIGRIGSLTLFVCLTCSIAHSEDWPRWGGPRGDGTWRGPAATQKLPEKWPEAGLPVVWRKEIGGGFGGISVSDGRAFVMDRQPKPIERERTLCFDADSGTVLWTDEYQVTYGKLDYGNGPRVTPTIHDGRVYTLGALGHLRCLDAATGKLNWSHDCVVEFEATIPMWGLAASPVIWHDFVIVHPGAKNGCVMAFDRLTGKEMWRVSDDPAGYGTPIIIAAPSGPQLVQWTPEHILGIEPKSGKQLWRVPYKITYGVSIATPIYQQEIVFIAGYWDGSKAIQLGKSATDAKLLWEDNRHLRGIMSQPLYRDGYVYLLDKQYGLTCFELRTGKKLWDDDNKATPRGRNPQATLVWLTNEPDRALILNSEGDLILARINPSGYREQSRTRIIDVTDTNPVWAHPAYAGTRVYARNDKEIVCRRMGKSEE